MVIPYCQQRNSRLFHKIVLSERWWLACNGERLLIIAGLTEPLLTLRLRCTSSSVLPGISTLISGSSQRTQPDRILIWYSCWEERDSQILSACSPLVQVSNNTRIWDDSIPKDTKHCAWSGDYKHPDNFSEFRSDWIVSWAYWSLWFDGCRFCWTYCQLDRFPWLSYVHSGVFRKSPLQS